ncbi:MAG: exodeoxyribonuclease I [bacterium]|nr:exodeoxyribonuclease I [bacterium]
MKKTFYFYDLETTGINPRRDRIMQFAGQRTDMDLNAVGDPNNILVKIAPDVVPSPDAILITGITPQKSIQEGITEAEFLKIFEKEINIPGTIFVGFNSIRFDDEFMRHTMWRNYHEPYEWHWKDARSRWDLLDLVRATRALRPDGIEWPVDSEGKATNRLEYLTKVNKISHVGAHDALSDVNATIGVARMIKSKQPKLFEYFLSIRGKKDVVKLVEEFKPFVYVSGKYPSEFEKVATVVAIGPHPKKGGSLVYDLRHDPTEFVAMTPVQLVDRWKWEREPKTQRLPVKTLQYNRCPAVGPLGVIDDSSKKRLKIDFDLVQANLAKLKTNQKDFYEKLLKALEMMDKQRQTAWTTDENDVDSQLYDGFVNNSDKYLISDVRRVEPEKLSNLANGFKDERLKNLMHLYKARNHPKFLTDEEKKKWETHVQSRLQDEKTGLQAFFNRLGELADRKGLSKNDMYLLEELQLYGESLLH